MTTHTYEILALDVWGNARDGWELNQTFYTGVRVEIPDDADDAAALKAIRKALGHRADARGYHDPYGDEQEFFFVRNKDGKPAYIAQRVWE